MAGIADSLLLVTLCGTCTFLTGISLSAIATNGAMKVLFMRLKNITEKATIYFGIVIWSVFCSFFFDCALHVNLVYAFHMRVIYLYTLIMYVRHTLWITRIILPSLNKVFGRTS